MERKRERNKERNRVKKRERRKEAAWGKGRNGEKMEIK